MTHSVPAVPLLRLLVGAALVVPVVVYAAFGWVAYGDAWRAAEAQLRRETALLAEHNLRLFDAHLLVAANVSGRVADALTRGTFDERTIHDHLRTLLQGLPQVNSIWVVGGDGRLLGTSEGYPAPRDVSIADRPYFRAARDGAGVVIREVARGRVGGRLFFSVNRAIRDADGGFLGVVVVSARPGYFSQVFGRLLEGQTSTAALLRDDGTFLAAVPDTLPGPEPPYARLPPSGGLFKAIARAPAKGTYVFRSIASDTRKLYAYHKLGDLPLYVILAREAADIAAAWRAEMLRLLPWVVVGGGLLVLLAWLALRQARGEAAAMARLRQEQARSAAAEDALRRAQRLEAMGQLTGGVAHDFNNLMQVVSSSLSLLRRDGPPELRDKALASLETAVRRGRDLTGHLLTFARRQSVAPRPLALSDEVRRLETLLSHTLRADIALSIEVPAATWPVFIDPGEFDLALLNLVLNARDAMPGGGRLSVVARNEWREADGRGPGGGYVALSVRDTGHGIPADRQERVFEPFFSTKEAGQGTGLGLSQVYGFARQAGGFVTLFSEPGAGTLVTLWLPRSTLAPAPRQVTAQAGEPEAPPRPLRLLVVEDDPTIAASSAGLLAQAGHTVTTAGTGAAALALLSDGLAVDVVLSDIMMPGGLDGLALARALRHRWPALPVVLVTGYSASAEAARAEGFRVLHKPVDEAALRRALAEAAEDRPVPVPQAPAQ